MMPVWETMTLQEAGVVLLDCLHKTPKAMAAGYPYVAIPQMRGGRLDLRAARKISHSDFVEWTSRADPRTHDVVLSRRCNPGETAHVGEDYDFALGQNLVLLRADGVTIEPGFLRWLVTSPAWWGQVQRFINVGAVFDSLRCAEIPRFRLPIPPLAEQRAIASILGALDDKIDLNRRMNETLEAMARAIFKSWFVDFDPVRAKADGRQPFGMDTETAALFPDRLVESELGEVPEGWTVATLGELSAGKPQYGYTTSGCEWTEGPRFLRIADINKSPWVDWSSVPGCADVPEDRDKYKLEAGDLVIARMADPGHSYYCTSMPETVFASYLIRFRPLTKSLGWYLGYWTKSTAYWALVNGRSSGSTRANLNAKVLSAFPAIRPRDDVAAVFEEIVAPLRSVIDQNCKETITLAELRDLLLPKLLSGDIRVKDAEKTVEAVA